MAGLEDILGGILSSPEGIGKMAEVMKLIGGDAAKPEAETQKKGKWRDDACIPYGRH